MIRTLHDQNPGHTPEGGDVLVALLSVAVPIGAALWALIILLLWMLVG